MQARIQTAQWAPAALLGLAAVCLGILAGVNPPVAVAAALALTFALITFADLAAGLSVFAVISFAEALRIGDSPLLSGTKIAGAVLALSWLATLTTRGSSRSGAGLVADHRGFVYLTILFGTWAVLSNQWAGDLQASGIASFGYVVDLALFPIVYAAIREPKHVRWVLGAFVFGAVLASVQGMIFPPPPESSLEAEAAAGRLIGAGITPNYLAGLLVASLVILAGLFAASSRSSGARVAIVSAVAICSLGFVLTLSRTGLVALAVCLLASVTVARRRRASAVVLTLLVATATVAYFGFLGPPEARDRVQTLESGSGRTELWTVGWRMVEDRPITGVGAGNYSDAAPRYLLAEPGRLVRDDLILDKALTAHNMYLEILAELGIPGLTLFLMIIGYCLVATARAAQIYFRLGDRSLDVLSRSVFVAQMGLLVAACFNSIQFIPQLWLLLALGPVLLTLSRAQERNAQHAAATA